MTEVWHGNRDNVDRLPLGAGQPQRRRNSLLRMPSVVDTYLLVMLIVLPIQRFTLPLNAALLEVLNAIALPFFWLYVIPRQRKVHLPYATAMWLILLGSLIAMFDSSIPSINLAVILKDLYLYVWFVTLVVLFSNLSANKLRRFMVVWVIIVMLHGILILAQFLSPEILQATTAGVDVEKYGRFGAYRPMGLFQNPNMAAGFQLVGFVPLLLLAPPIKVTLIAGLLLLVGIVATGSLGASIAFLSGMICAFVASMTVSNKRIVTRFCFGLAVATLLLAGLYWLADSHYPDYVKRLEMIFFGRFEGSAAERYLIWQGAIDAFTDVRLWGVGPGNYMGNISGISLHNDLIAFWVERGLIGALGLVLLGLLAIGKSVSALLKHGRHPSHAPVVLILLAAIIAIFTQSLTHQVFHFRFFWVVLALQVAMLLRIDESERRQSTSPIS